MIESLNYRIELVAYSLQLDTGNVKIKGKSFARLKLHRGTLKENSGNISMELVESGDSYLIKRLYYTPQSTKKVEKQPEWGPWKEIED